MYRDVILKKHRVVNASFSEKMENEKKKSLELTVEGNVMIPKKWDETRQVMIKLQLQLGNSNERLFLALESISVFEIVEGSEHELTEEVVQQKCLPVAFTNLRKTVKEVSEAHGLSPLNLAPFDGKDVEK